MVIVIITLNEEEQDRQRALIGAPLPLSWRFLLSVGAL